MSVSSPVSSLRLQLCTFIFLLGISTLAFWLPLTQKYKTRMSPLTSPIIVIIVFLGTEPLFPSIIFVPPYSHLSYLVSYKPYGFFLVMFFYFCSFSFHLYPGPHLLLTLLHWYSPSFFFFFNHWIILSFHCQTPLMAPRCLQGEV